MDYYYWSNNNRRSRTTTTTPLFCCCCCIISICSLLFICALFTTIGTSRTSTCLDIRNQTGSKADSHFQVDFGNMEERKSSIKSSSSSECSEETDVPSSIRRIKSGFAFVHRRFLSVPGSSPPRCTSKCGKCKPCKPVHVPVPPGTPVTMEYYPEAWRCKCGNRLYMP